MDSLVFLWSVGARVSPFFGFCVVQIEFAEVGETF